MLINVHSKMALLYPSESRIKVKKNDSGIKFRLMRGSFFDNHRGCSGYPGKGLVESLFALEALKEVYKIFPSLMTNTEEFGLAMINAVLFGSTNKILENRDIRELAKTKDFAKKYENEIS